MNETIQEFNAYIEAPTYDPTVSQLAQTGIKRYQTLSSLQNARRAEGVGAGRTPNWIQDTFDQSEDEMITSLSQIPGPPTWTVASIDSAYQYWQKKNPPSSLDTTLPTLTMVKGVSVNFLHEVPLAKNSILQLASQFNFLESPNNQITPVSAYLYDSTQGPQGSIEAGAAALHRTAAVRAQKLHHALTMLLPANHQSYYQNGYLELFKIPDDQLSGVFNYVKQRVSKMRVLAQWVQCEASGRVQLQVFSAAPSYQGVSMPQDDSIGAQFCRFVVGTQYEVIGKLAVIRSLIAQQNVPVHLTLVGQGAFNNPPSVLKVALKRLADVIKGCPRVYVYLHAYNEAGQQKVRGVVDPSAFLFREMTREEFGCMSLPIS
ncbi:hypothetical protein [Pajaroellobacter abortibovis]|nr:hypothetical protein [Pajaroellobacter abortibovis]